MQRRTFVWSTPGPVLALGLALSGCTTSPSDASNEQSDKRHTGDAGADSILSCLYHAANTSRELADTARGVLIFPSVVDASTSTEQWTHSC